jgi:hypothetical protein
MLGADDACGVGGSPATLRVPRGRRDGVQRPFEFPIRRPREREANRTTRDWCIQARLCVIQHDISFTEEDPP